MILPYLRKIGYQNSVEDFFKLKNEYEIHGIDHDALQKIARINEKYNNCFVGSNQDFRRKEFLVTALNLKETMKESYFSCDFGYVKPQIQFWQSAYENIKKCLNDIKKSEIMFLDDRKENIDSAKDYGFSTILINTRNDLHIVLDNYILS
jgi:FMN phosphatase YigB (HAD superfamily)